MLEKPPKKMDLDITSPSRFPLNPPNAPLFPARLPVTVENLFPDEPHETPNRIIHLRTLLVKDGLGSPHEIGERHFCVPLARFTLSRVFCGHPLITRP